MVSKYRGCRYNGKRMRLHVAMYLEKHGLDTLPEGYVVHHRDFNPLNNTLKNLRLMTAVEHNRLHSSLRKRNKKGQFC